MPYETGSRVSCLIGEEPNLRRACRAGNSPDVAGYLDQFFG